MRGGALFILISLTIGAMTGSICACPGCQNPTLPITPSGGVFLDQHAIQWGALLSAAPMWVKHEAGCVDLTDCDQRPIQPLFIHDQLIAPFELRLSAELGLSERLGVSFQLPLRLIHTTIDYHKPNGDPYEPLDANVHHRNETLIGLGDAVIAMRWSQPVFSGWWLLLQLGSSLPFGRTEADPFIAGAQGEAHQHLQFGSGTFDPYIALSLARSWRRWQLNLYGQASGAIYENQHTFQAGVTSLLNSQISYSIHPKSLLHLGLGWFTQGPERWGGEVQQDGILGRQELLLSLGGTVSFGGPQYRLLLRTPVWRKITQGSQTEEGDITSPISLTLGLQGQL